MKHPQISRTQLELWLEDPATKALTKCLGWLQSDVKDEINTGSCVDMSNADLTLSRISQRTGQIEGLETASYFEDLFKRYEMIEEGSHVQAV